MSIEYGKREKAGVIEQTAGQLAQAVRSVWVTGERTERNLESGALMEVG